MHIGKIGILEPLGFSSAALSELQQLASVELYDTTCSLASFLADKEILFIRLHYYIGVDFLAMAPMLRWICTPTTGLTHLDEKALTGREIGILSLQGEQAFLNNVRATPEHILGLTLSLLRNYKDAFRSTGRVDWDRDRYRGHEIYGKRVGIIGLGRVGRILARYFRVLEANILYYDIDPAIVSPAGTEKAKDIGSLIDASNIVLLCASLNTENLGLITPALIDRMCGKYFVNAARGELIDEGYLADKINEGHFAGVALDVIQQETARENRLQQFLALTSRHNLILTPHVGGATYESMAKTEEFMVKKLAALLATMGDAKK